MATKCLFSVGLVEAFLTTGLASVFDLQHPYLMSFLESDKEVGHTDRANLVRGNEADQKEVSRMNSSCLVHRKSCCY